MSVSDLRVYQTCEFSLPDARSSIATLRWPLYRSFHMEEIVAAVVWLCSDEGRNNAKTQTWKKQLGSFWYRARLHGNELWLRPRWRQTGDDLGHPGGRGTRRHILRYCGSLRPFHKRRTRGWSPRSVPLASGHRHPTRVPH